MRGGVGFPRGIPPAGGICPGRSPGRSGGVAGGSAATAAGATKGTVGSETDSSAAGGASPSGADTGTSADAGAGVGTGAGAGSDAGANTDAGACEAGTGMSPISCAVSSWFFELSQSALISCKYFSVASHSAGLCKKTVNSTGVAVALACAKGSSRFSVASPGCAD